MPAKWLLTLATIIEAVTGLALIIYPQAVTGLLLGAGLAGAGIVAGRMTGAALLSLGLGCWMSGQEAGKKAMLAAMLTYNLLVALYLAYLGLGGEMVGILLWPAIVLHAVLAILFAHAYFDSQLWQQLHAGKER